MLPIDKMVITQTEQLLVEALCFKAGRPESLSKNEQNQRSVKLIEKQPCLLHKERAGSVSPWEDH